MDFWGLIFASIIPLGLWYFTRKEEKRVKKFGVTSRTGSYSGKFLGPETQYFKDGYRVYFSKNDKGEDCIRLYKSGKEYYEGIEYIKFQKDEKIKIKKIIDSNDIQFVGNTTSKKYHDKKCEWAIRTNIHNKVPFNSAKEARDQGYTPCNVCLGNTNKK
ncbi:MAG TPA: hypothetical protein DIC60_04590 [Lachnospiraceae bacterium]|nr:hypothetical protein [Lachnospiraceae bacterium]